MLFNPQKGELLLEFVRTNFKLRYRNSILGFVWVLLKPLLTFVVLYFVFINFNRGVKIENYALYLLIGITMFNFFSECLTFGMTSLFEKAHIILKVNFDRTLAVLSSMIQAGVNFALNLVVLVVFFVISPVHIEPINVLYFVFIAIVLFVFMSGLAFFTSVIFLQLRDLENLVPIFLQLFFYATPVFYSIEILPQRLQEILKFNPMYILIQTARESIVAGKIENFTEVIIVGIISIFLFLLGRLFFNARVKKVAEYF